MIRTSEPHQHEVTELVWCYTWDIHTDGPVYFAYFEGGRMGRLFVADDYGAWRDHFDAVRAAFRPSQPARHRAPGGEPAHIVPRDRPESSWRALAGLLDSTERST